MFMILLVMGLVGLGMMAFPAFGRHGHGHAGHHVGAHGAGHAAAGHAAAGHAAAGHAAAGHAAAGHAAHASVAAKGERMLPADPGSHGLLRYVPSPRVIFTLMALYGAFGNALVEAAGLPTLTAALLAVVPALLIDRLVVNPLWNLLLRFQGRESSPLEMLLLSEAQAVVPFRNGRGVVAVNRDGRLVQLSAQLVEADLQQTVKVGDKLRIDEIDTARERVAVSVIR